MNVKIIRSYSHKGLEKYINLFLDENKDEIHIIEIKFNFFFEYVAMIVYEKIVIEE